MDDFYSMYYFSAKEKDEESGFYYYGARYQNPMLAMFNQMDKLWDARPWESPLSYCGNNPITRRDPTGLIWETTDDQKQADKIQKGIGERYKALDKQEAGIKNEMSKIQSKNYSQAKHDKKMATQQAKLDDIAGQRQHLADLDKGINQLGSSENRYTFSTSGSDLLGLTKENGVISINHDGTIETKVHEMTHAIQYDNGSLYFDIDGNARASGGQGGIYNSERQAYGNQFSYTGGISLPNGTTGSTPISIRGISNDWLGGIEKRDGTPLYKIK